ncbi:MAG TPA: hypothetical protein VG734_09325 [Lacunisphaera sp.]|nr:hypothetical protein [Lacunisphaera sp.]
MKTSSKYLSLLGGLVCLTLSAPAQSYPDSSKGSQSSTTRPSSSTSSSQSSKNDTMSPSTNDSTSRSNTSSYNSQSSTIAGQRFNNLDKDNDGKISRSEFTLASPQLQSGQNDTGKTEKKHWWNRNSSDKKATSTTDSDVTSASSSVEMFNQLDTDKDGFLSQSELNAQNGANHTDMSK